MKHLLTRIAGIFFLSLIALYSCKKDEPKPDTPVTPIVSTGKQIVAFNIVSPAAAGVIDTVNRVITISIPGAPDVTNLTTSITLASGHTISPASGVAQDFTDPVVYTVTRPDNTTTTWTVKVETSLVTVDQDIAQSVTWTADKVYYINSDINIGDNAVLTIEPGTVIRFGANGSLSIGYYSNATIIANGTSAAPITFTSSAALPVAGAWDGLYFYDKTLNNSTMAYCNIVYAGNDADYGAVNLLGCEIAMNNCTVSQSGSYGIYTEYNNEKGGFVSFNNNTIDGTVKNSIVMHAQELSSIGTGNIFTNTSGVLVEGNYNNSTSQTWKKLSVPYLINYEMSIDGKLTIEPGTVFEFDGNGWISVGYYASTTLIADGGSSATAILFTSSDTGPLAGSWRGVAFYDHVQPNTKINYCTFDYAGSDPDYGAVTMWDNSSIIFTHNLIRNSASYGVKVDYNAGFESFQDNIINTCDNHVIMISNEHLPDLGSPNNLTAKAGYGINIYGDVQYSTAVTWRKQTADFYVTDGEDDIDGVVTIEPGCKFYFSDDSYFWFGYYASTKITAVGTSADPIIFTSAALSPAPGNWAGLYFDSNHTQSNSALDYCEFQYTGRDDTPAIYTGVSFPVSNTTISDYSSTNAAEYASGIAVPSGTGNNFTWVAN